MGCGQLTLLSHPNAGGFMHSDIPTLQHRLARSRAKREQMVYTTRLGESEFVKVKNMVRYIGFLDNFDWVSGVDPYNEELHRLVFAATIDGHRVQCSISYDHNKLWDAENIELASRLLGDALRKDVAFHVATAYRKERSYIYQAIAMYHPRLPFFLAYLWWRLEPIREWIRTHW